MRLAAVAVFIVEIVLSHTPGVASGAQSQSLSRLTHLPEGFLRSFAHVALFLVLVLFAALGFGWVGVGVVAVWAVVDEATKRGSIFLMHETEDAVFKHNHSLIYTYVKQRKYRL